MSKRKDYTDDEWMTIATAPLKVAILASEADRGIIAHAREVAAYPGTIAAALQKYGANELVLAVLNDEENSEEEEDLQERVEHMKVLEHGLLEEFRPEVLLAVALVTEKSRDEVTGYKEMLYSIADAIVNASGEGFLGTGEKVSSREKAFMKDLRESLGL